MKLKSTVIKNYRGIKEETLVSFQDFDWNKKYSQLFPMRIVA